MGTMEQFVKTMLKKSIAEDYSHLRLPSIVYASITAARELTDTYELTDLTLTDTSGASFRATATAHWSEYTLHVIDRDGNRLDQYPTLPGVRSRHRLEVGTVVAVGLCNGELEPVIIGAVDL